MIEQDTIDRILAASDIVQEISAHVALRKVGKSLSGLCPFHTEKTPSFRVSPEHQRYHCFGCGASGNLINFLMEHCGMDFPSAVRDLSQKTGIALESAPSSPAERARLLQRKSREDRLFAAMHKAQQHYRQRLQSHGPALAYASQTRKLLPETIERFALGYSDNASCALLKCFGTDYNDPIMEQSGLVAIDDEASAPRRYDRFRHRLMFPVRDLQGRTIAFGGRLLPDGPANAPKYLNSPETELFQKSHTLYGLFEARPSIRQAQSVYVVEGYMDAVSLAQYGVPNTVATMGVAFTAEHFKLLRRHTERICFLFDGDKAGQQAALRAMQTVLPLLDEKTHIEFLHLPDALDPDEYLDLHGLTAFQALPRKTLSEFLLAHLQAQWPLHTLEARCAYQREATRLLDTMPPKLPLKKLLSLEVENRSGMRRSPAMPARRSDWHVEPAPHPSPSASGLWAHLLQATERAPAVALEMAETLIQLIDPQTPDEKPLFEALLALNNRHDSLPELAVNFEQLAAADILRNAATLIRSHRAKQAHQALRERLASGQAHAEEITSLFKTTP